MPKPVPSARGPMPTVVVTFASSGILIFCCPATNFQSTEEAGGVSGGEKLLGVGTDRAVAAEFLRNRQRDVEYAVFRYGVAGTTACGGCFRV